MRTIGELAGTGDDNWVQRRTPLGLAVAASLAVIVISIILGAIGYASGWIGEAGRVTGVENVREQWRFAYDYDEDLRAIAVSHCAAVETAEGETDPDIGAQRNSQTLAIEQNYARVAGDYNAALRDKFRAGLVAPPDVPERAPTLTEMEAEVCVSTR